MMEPAPMRREDGWFEFADRPGQLYVRVTSQPWIYWQPGNWAAVVRAERLGADRIRASLRLPKISAQPPTIDHN